MAPRCIVEVRWGRRAGTKAVIEPGMRLWVGGSDRADLVIPEDSKLSGAHFELRWDGRRCALRDLGSMMGTRLDGAPVRAADVQHGAWIQAGETDFMVYVEGKSGPREEDAEELDEGERRRLAAAEKALSALREAAAKAPLYAVLDAARGERILEILRESVERHQSLYEGAPGEVLDEVAPYLAGPIGAESRSLERLVMEGWGRRWGIWCTSWQPFPELRRHWRRLLMVQMEDTGNRLYLRFYDPAVMATLWSACTERQRQQIMRETNLLIIERGLSAEPIALNDAGA